MADDADETIGVGKLSCLGGGVQLKLLGIHFCPQKGQADLYPKIPALATVFKAATQSRITETDTLFQTKQAVPEVGKSLPSYLIFQQANEHAQRSHSDLTTDADTSFTLQSFLNNYFLSDFHWCQN